MQNSMSKRNLKSLIISEKINQLISKIKDALSIEYLNQQDSQTIIDRLNMALSFNKEITIQTRQSEYDDNVVNYKGTLIQNVDGKLFLKNGNDFIKIKPTNIQAIL